MTLADVRGGKDFGGTLVLIYMKHKYLEVS